MAVEDAYGNVVTTDTSAVTIAVTSGPGGLAAGSTTSVSAVNGVATFSNLLFDTAGTYTLNATDGTLSSATSGSITISPAAASHIVLQQSPTTGTAGQALSPSVQVALEDAFGNVVTGNTSTVVIAVAGGPGGLTAGSTTSVAAVSGVATFSNLVLDTAGTYTLKAIDGALTGVTSGNITVSPAAASRLVLEQSPTTATAGQALGPSVQVAVEDAFGNVVTSNSSTVQIAVGSGPGSLTAGSTTSVAAVSGVATFGNLVLDTAGTFTLKVTDGALTSATSGNITVSAAAASRLVVRQSPTTGTAGQALSPSVQVAVEDAFGNMVTSNTSTTQIAVVSGPGIWAAGSTTSVPVINGVATFSNLLLDTAGTYSFKATDGALTSAATGNIAMIPAAASQLVVLQSPTGGTSGQTLGKVTIAVEDGFGNLVTADASTVTIAVTSGPGDLNPGSTTSVAAVGGVATFSNLILNQAGSYHLIAGDGSFPDSVSINVTVNLPATDQLVFLQSPASATAGQIVSPFVKVAVENQLGNLLVGDTSAITLTLNSGVFANGGNTATVRAVNGVATFSNLIIDQVGNYTLRANDGTLMGPTSPHFAVNSAAASKLVFLQTPGTATAGQDLSPSVQVAVEDQFGNLVTGNKSTVTLLVHSGPAGFIKTSQLSVAAVNGVASFSKLILQKAGSYTLGGTDGSLAGAPFQQYHRRPCPGQQIGLPRDTHYRPRR